MDCVPLGRAKAPWTPLKQLQGRQPRKVENSVAIQLGRDPAYESHEKMALGKKPAAEP